MNFSIFKARKTMPHLKKRIPPLPILLFVLFAAICTVCGMLDHAIPNSISVYAADTPSINCPFVTVSSYDTSSLAASSRGFVGSYTATAKLFNSIDIKEVDVRVYDRAVLYPGGMAFGVKLYTKGVIVVGLSDIAADDGSTSNPASEAGIRIKDIITEINGKEVNSAAEVTAAIEGCDGNAVTVKLMRGESECNFTLKPEYSSADGKYKAGIWIRDSTAGIGTVTYIDPSSGAFAGLGHGICDIDTEELMPLLKGSVVNVTVSGITKGLKGTPGELKGFFGTANIGSLSANTRTGVYGKIDSIPSNLASKAIPIALKSEVQEGEACIYCTLDDNKVKQYSVNIERICDINSQTKNFIVEVTDQALLETTGGIVQGMSGSPIIQNGRIIGAVTHVLVNDPTRGYGIFIENMLGAAG